MTVALDRHLEAIATFLEEAVYPREVAWLQAGLMGCEGEWEALRDRVRALGLWAPPAPRAWGGMGLSLLEFARVSEWLGHSPFGHLLFGCQAPDAGNIEILAQFGTPEQQERFLVPLAAGRIRSCFAMTEPGTPGSNPTELACRARRDGDHYVIDGHKWFATGADGAAFAVVMAVTDPEAPRHRRATQILVPTDTPGFELVRNVPVMGHAGAGYFTHGEVRFTACRVPVANRLGGEGDGFAIAQERLGPGRIHHAMRWIGICERAFDLMVRRARGREMGRGETLAEKPLIQVWIAESRARIEAARLLVLKAAELVDGGGFEAAREAIALVKFHVSEVMQEVVDRAVQVHGALGLTDDTVLAYFYAHERAAKIYDGPNEVHKIAAARSILRRSP